MSCGWEKLKVFDGMMAWPCLVWCCIYMYTHMYKYIYMIVLWKPFIYRIIQNHRMVGVGRDLCGSSSPTLLPKQGHLQQAAQDLVQAGLLYLQRRRLHNLLWQPVPVLHHPQREEVLAQCLDGTSCASVCAHCPLSCHWAPLKRAWPHPPDTHPSDICRHL